MSATNESRAASVSCRTYFAWFHQLMGFLLLPVNQRCTMTRSWTRNPPTSTKTRTTYREQQTKVVSQADRQVLSTTTTHCRLLQHTVYVSIIKEAIKPISTALSDGDEISATATMPAYLQKSCGRKNLPLHNDLCCSGIIVTLFRRNAKRYWDRFRQCSVHSFDTKSAPPISRKPFDPESANFI